MGKPTGKMVCFLQQIHLKKKEGEEHRKKGLANFYKGINGKYFGLCRSCSQRCNHSPPPLQVKRSHIQLYIHEYGCMLIKLYLKLKLTTFHTLSTLTIDLVKNLEVCINQIQYNMQSLFSFECPTVNVFKKPSGKFDH